MREFLCAHLAWAQMVESPHPYPAMFVKTYEVKVPGAQLLRIQLDPRCTTASLGDTLVMRVPPADTATPSPFSQRQVHQVFCGGKNLGYGTFHLTGGSLIVPGDTVFFDFTAAPGDIHGLVEDADARWGFRAAVTAFLPGAGETAVARLLSGVTHTSSVLALRVRVRGRLSLSLSRSRSHTQKHSSIDHVPTHSCLTARP